MSTRSKPVAQLRGRPTTAEATVKPLVGAMEIPIDQVVPDSEQPRHDWEYGDGRARLEELANSIREFGILQPLSVRQEGTLADGRPRYVIIAGGRRYAAAQTAGLQSVPVVVRGADSERVRLLQLTENLQRQDLSPLDEARAYQELLDLQPRSAEELAKSLFISGQHVRERLRLLTNQVLADAVERRQISATAAREIMRLPDEAATTFKTRVIAGEKLQSNDIAAERARLAAAGVINPRHKGGGRAAARPALKTTVPASTGQTSPQAPASPLGGDVARPSTGHQERADQATLDPGALLADQASLDTHRDQPSANPAPTAEEAHALAARVGQAIAASLDGDQRAVVRDALAQMSGQDAWASLVLQIVRKRLQDA